MADVMCDCDETYEFAGGRVHCRTCGASWEPLVVTPEATVLGTALDRRALPTDSAERKRTPLCTGCLDYFSAALTAMVERLAGVGCGLGPLADDTVSALRDRDWVSVAVLALCDLDAELGGSGDLDNVLSVQDLFTEFAGAMAAVAQVSWLGNEKHNPGEPLHHARGKSMDHADCVLRHLVEAGTRQEEIVPGIPGALHTASRFWRALAALQEERESLGAPLARGAVLP